MIRSILSIGIFCFFLPSFSAFLYSTTSSFPRRIAKSGTHPTNRCLNTPVESTATMLLKIRERRPHYHRPRLPPLFAAEQPDQDTDATIVSAQDLEGLQKLFADRCDTDGLMTRSVLEQTPFLAELLVRPKASVFLYGLCFAEEESCSNML